MKSRVLLLPHIQRQMTNPDLAIPELIKILRHSFLECEFDEVQHILMDRDKKMKMEIQDLKRDLESMSLAELVKLKTEKKLKGLNEKVTRLSEECRVSCDRAKRAEELHGKLSKEFANIVCEKNELNVKINEMKNTIVELRRKQSESDKEHWVSCDKAKRAEERHDKLSKEFANIVCEKDKLILELNEKINGLKNRIVENEQVVVELSRKQSEVDKEVCEKDKLILELNEKINELKNRIVKNEQLVAELRRKQSEVDKEACEKDKLILELNQKINDLKNRIVENEHVVVEMKRKQSGVDKEAHEKYKLNEKINGMKNTIVENEQLVVELRRKKSEFDNEVCEKDKLILELNEKNNELKSRIVENEQVVVELKRKKSESDKEVAQNFEATRLLNELRHGKRAKFENLASGKKVGVADMIKGNGSTNADAKNVVIVPDVVCGTSSDDSPLVIIKGGRNVVHTRKDGDGAVTGSRASLRSSKTTRAAREVIEINDSDDEAKPGSTKFISGASSGKKKRRG